MFKDRYGGGKDTPPYQPTLRVVRPPLYVLIDLGALYGRQPQFKQKNSAVPETLRTVVIGQLDAWILCDIGWMGACRHRVHLGLKQLIEQRQLVPSWVLKPADGSDVEQAFMRGELQR
jgi:hypothetical protein